MEYLYLLLCFVASIFITPLVKKIALKFKITDKPNHRKVHQKIYAKIRRFSYLYKFYDRPNRFMAR